MNTVISVINATSPADLQEQLDKAVALAQEESTAGQRVGILVTRCAPHQFIVELHTTVAFGEIRELDASSRVPDGRPGLGTPMHSNWTSPITAPAGNHPRRELAPG